MTKEQIEKAAEAWVDANHPKSMVFIETTLVAFAVEQVNAAKEEDASLLLDSNLREKYVQMGPYVLPHLVNKIRALKVKP